MKTLLSAEMIPTDEWNATIHATDKLLNVTTETTSEYFTFASRTLCSHNYPKPIPVTVLLAEDRTIVRQGIYAVLALEKEIRVIGEASNGRQAVEMAERLHPDVVVISGAMAFLNRMLLTRRILRADPAPRVIILARHSDDAYARQAVSIGAAGFLTEQISAQMLVRTLLEARDGNRVFGPGISQCLPEKASYYPTKAASRKSTSPLTTRQKQILQLIAEGNANKQTAEDLSISIKTVEKHRENIMAKLGIHETAGLTRYAISAGILKDESITQV